MQQQAPSPHELEAQSLAVCVRDLHKFYGTGRGAHHVLRSLNMDVPYGSIYGLLGASGCGKTTLLRCVLGRLPTHCGKILILGQPPGAPGHTVPGKDVGYMPQETALVAEFTMIELMYYFGILYKMNLKFVRRRTEFLKDFLNLPAINKICGQLSGGQQRRVSFALALLHEPPLLILDEPTVGIDPLLRAKIWRHLLEITSSGNTTIIITTHYIEEARQAHWVGLMRSGRLLAQSKPDDLIRQHNVLTLEDVFLKLSEQQEVAFDKKVVTKGASIQNVDDEEPSEGTPLLGSQPTTVKPPGFFSSIHLGIPRMPKLFNVAALTWKQGLKFLRQPLLFFFVVINPMLQIGLFCLAYGQDLKGVTIYYTNYDTKPYYSPEYNQTFHLGERFLAHIDADTLELKSIGNSEEGIEKVRDGKAWGYFKIPPDYSRNYFLRINETCRKVLNPTSGNDVNSSVIDGAIVQLSMDVTNQQIYFTVTSTLSQAYTEFTNEVLDQVGIPRYYFSPLLNITDYVYGGPDLRFVDFTGPGLIAGLTFAISITLTATNLITERKEGLIDRTWVAGVSVVEIVLSQNLAFFIVVTLQLIPLTFFTVYAFDIERQGNLALVVLIAVLQGMSGVNFGLVISSFLNTESTALEVSVGIFYPVLLVGGVLWPLQALDEWMQAISYATPITYPAEAIRSVLLRGWGLGDEPVYMAVVVLVSWSVLFGAIAALGMQLKKF